MKTRKMIKQFRVLPVAAILFSAITLVSCGNDDDAAPAEENDLEVFTDVTLIFTNKADATDVVTASAQDPDGIGAQELVVSDDIVLSADTEYTLSMEVLNTLNPAEPNIGEEIEEEDNEHQFFFSFTDGVFTSPTGDGNVDVAADPINYDDADENMLPVGLITTWATGAATAEPASFTARLQHQPDVKTATSGAEDGDTDFDLTFTLIVE